MITDVMVAAVDIEEPTKKEKKDKIVKEIQMSQHDLKVYQDCPNTFITMKFIYLGVTFETFGFSKANWPDPWDEAYGIALAVEKAIHKAARVITNSKGIKPSSPIVEDRVQR